jgi:hypothetical protein
MARCKQGSQKRRRRAAQCEESSLHALMGSVTWPAVSETGDQRSSMLGIPARQLSDELIRIWPVNQGLPASYGFQSGLLQAPTHSR